MSVRGQVKWFEQDKGFGFITIDEGRDKGTDIFVHASDVKGNPLRDGDEVEFYVDERKGKKRASEVTGGTGRKDDWGGKGGGRGGYGGGKGGGKRDEWGGGGGKSRKAGDWDCGECGFMNFASRYNCMKCGADKPNERSRGRGRADSRRR